MTDSARVRALREALGRELAARRGVAGWTQAGLAQRAGYSRSSVATIERGTQAASGQFWAACDRVLQTGGLFTSGHARIRAQQESEHRETATAARGTGAPRLNGGWPGGHALDAADPVEAAAACRALGWQVEISGDGLELVTGDALDVLEVGRPAGILAAGWWAAGQGVPDLFRGLPGLPPPAGAMAVIAAGPQWFFLVQGAECPWTPQDTDQPSQDGEDAIRWHAHGSRVLAPPSRDSAGLPVAWARMPSPPVQLASPLVLLDLLAKATAAAREPGALELPGGVQVVLAAANRAEPSP